jgi:hypothetical protein
MKGQLIALVAGLAVLAAATTAGAAGPITGKVRGTFNRAGLHGFMIGGDNLRRYVKTPARYVWCGWQDGKVLVHVRMKNTSAEHLTVNWYPRYLIARGGWHGEGFTSVESDGFDSGEVRNLTSKQDPKGVKDNTRIASCRPTFQMIESG